MIVVKLIGGLGNQLFQYAFSKKVENQGFNIYHDVSDFKYYKKHGGLEIDKFFDLELKLAPLSISKKWQGKGYTIGALKRKFLNRLPKEYLSQKDLERIQIIPDNCYLDGYWQSSRFVDMSVVHGIRFKHFELHSEAKEMLQTIKSTRSVSLHIRRGDYLLGENANIYEKCTLQYYTHAVDYIQSQVGDCKLFIFSDDHDWVLNQLQPKLAQKSYLVNCCKGYSAAFDMYLMSHCKHNIIANSSFSWWAASVNENQNKIIVRPKRWYVEKSYNDSDLISLPSDWISIENE